MRAYLRQAFISAWIAASVLIGFCLFLALTVLALKGFMGVTG
jgi:hypothetical protein